MAPTEHRPEADDSQPPSRAWKRAFWLALPHGLAAGVHLPAGVSSVPADIIQRLHPREREHAVKLTGPRPVQWVAGRLALQHAAKRLRSRRLPFAARDPGGVIAPKGLQASVSHKRDLAVGLVGQASAGCVGVDLETKLPERLHLASRILRPEELERLEAIPAPLRWPTLLLHFSIKESIYKAIHPHVERYVGFHEAELLVGPNGSAQVTMHLEGGEGPFEIQARYHWLDQHLLTTALVRQPSG
jgi:4'-phosphopantetheinyl transferase EntD